MPRRARVASAAALCTAVLMIGCHEQGSDPLRPEGQDPQFSHQPGSGTPWKTFGNDDLDPSKNFLGTTDPVDLVVKTNNTEQMRVTSGGNVGIATTSPEKELHLVGTTNDAEIRITHPSGVIGDIGITDFGFQIGSQTNHSLDVFTNGGNGGRIRVNPNGNVGIGTLSPIDRLEVSGGNIRVTGGSFIDDGTTLNAPDYVFEEDYPLMPLEELRAHIARQKHLPNVPSADDIRKSGLNLSQFQMTLLEKIEELTLYTLQQQEEIETLTARVKMLEARLITAK